MYPGEYQMELMLSEAAKIEIGKIGSAATVIAPCRMEQWGRNLIP